MTPRAAAAVGLALIVATGATVLAFERSPADRTQPDVASASGQVPERDDLSPATEAERAAPPARDPAEPRRVAMATLAEQQALHAPAGDLDWDAARALVLRRRAAEEALLARLASLGPGGARALRDAYLQAASLRARLLLVRALAAIEDPEAPDVLASLLDRRPPEDLSVRAEIVASLARRSEPAAERALVALLAPETEPRLRFAAANGLAGRPGALAALAETLRRDPDATVRREAVRSIGLMGHDAARDLLLAVVRDRSADRAIRQVATHELARSFGGRARDPGAPAGRSPR